MNRIRVLQISSGFAVEGPSGGLGRFAMELSRKLDQTRVEPILCGLWDHGTELEQQRLRQLEQEGVEAFTAVPFSESVPYQRFWDAYRAIRSHMAGRSVDVLHSHEQFGDVMALLLGPTLKPRAVVRTVHNEREWARRPLRRVFLTGLLYPLAFKLEVGVSQQVVDNLNARWFARLLNRRAVRIYNSLNLDRFTFSGVPYTDVRHELGINDGAVVLCSVGRLTAQKGYEILIDAMRGVVTQFPSVFLIVVGDGVLREALLGQVKRLGLDKNILFLGQRSDIECILSTSDLFVSSSLWEGLPTVIIESMAAGVPVIATDVSGTRELVSDEVTGYLVKPGDAEALQGKILYAIENIARTDSVVERARTRVGEMFSIENAADQYINLYLDVI